MLLTKPRKQQLEDAAEREALRVEMSRLVDAVEGAQEREEREREEKEELMHAVEELAKEREREREENEALMHALEQVYLWS